MNKLLKHCLLVALVCSAAGMVAFEFFTELDARSSRTESVGAAAGPAAQSVQRPTEVSPPRSWRFKLSATATDDPELSRQTSTAVEYLGETAQCDEPTDISKVAGHANRSGGAASATQELTVCVPACGAVVPSPAAPRPLRGLVVTAFQQDFERPPENYAPEGQLASLEWACAESGLRVRLSAASLVALSCNTDACDDIQVANAAVYLSAETGTAFDSIRALFSLQAADGRSVVGTAFPD